MTLSEWVYCILWYFSRGLGYNIMKYDKMIAYSSRKLTLNKNNFQTLISNKLYWSLFWKFWGTTYLVPLDVFTNIKSLYYVFFQEYLNLSQRRSYNIL